MEYNCEKPENLVQKIKFSEPRLLLCRKCKLQSSGNKRINISKDIRRLHLCARKIGPWGKKNDDDNDKNKNSSKQQKKWSKCWGTGEGRSRGEHCMTNGSSPREFHCGHCFDDDDFTLTKSCVVVNMF